MATLPFVQFVEGVLKVKLWQAQRTLCKVAFDGLNPADLEGEERELARKLFGEVERVPPEARDILVAVCGGRGGKSYLLGGLYSLWRALVADLSTLAPGEQAFGIIVDPDLRLARQTLRFAAGAARGCPSIKPLIESDTDDSLVLRRPDGNVVAIECLPATRGGSALRGRSLVSAVLDECAFFRNADYVVNDEELFKAVAPRVMPGGLVVLCSTPWAEGGLLYAEFSRNHGHPTTALACHAQTLLLRPDPKVRRMVERERERDPDNAAREFDAEFMPAGSGQLFDPQAIRDAVDANRALELPYWPRSIVGVGGDFAFRANSSVLAIVQREAEVFHLSKLLELRPKKGQPLQPSFVVAQFAAVTLGYGAHAVCSDGHYREAIQEHLTAFKINLTDAPGGQQGKAETYMAFRSLLHEGRVRLPNHPRLLQQLREVVSKPLPGGGVQISSPNRGLAGHGDLVSALVLAVWNARFTFNWTCRRIGEHKPVLRNLRRTMGGF